MKVSEIIHALENLPSDTECLVTSDVYEVRFVIMRPGLKPDVIRIPQGRDRKN